MRFDARVGMRYVLVGVRLGCSYTFRFMFNMLWNFGSIFHSFFGVCLIISLSRGTIDHSVSNG